MLKQALEDARELLKDPSLLNEKGVELGIIPPIFRELGWDVGDILGQFRPNFKIKEVRGRKVDYHFADFALFASDPDHPALLIEAKRPGRIDEAQTQVLRYANVLGGLRAAIATDGLNWHFYLPYMGTKEEERLALKISLVNDDLDYLAELLPKVLQRKAVAGERAKAELEKYHRQTKVSERFDDAWLDVLESQEFTKTVKKQFITKLRERIGTGPLPDSIGQEFIQRKLNKLKSIAEEPRPEPRPVIPIEGKTTRRVLPKKGTLYLLGESLSYEKRTDAMRKLFDWANRRDPDFLSKLADSAYVERQRTNRATYRVGSYWVQVNIHHAVIESFIRRCAKALDLEFGKDIRY